MRIACAILVITDLLIRFSDLKAHYTNEGIWPLPQVFIFGWRPGFWSLHTLFENYWWVFTLFLLQFVFALFLLLGYKTKLSTFIVWSLVLSLHNRNLFILQAGDDVLRLLLFWGLFLPWNARYSIDAIRNNTTLQGPVLAGPGYILLLVSVYLFSALFKTDAEWHQDASAVYYALSLEQLRLPLGDLLYKYPLLMASLTKTVYYSELMIPLLIILPAKKGYFRALAFTLILILNLGIGLSLYVGLFFIINIIAAIGLIPGFVFDKLEKHFGMVKNHHLLTTTHQLLKGTTEALSFTTIALCLMINLQALNTFPFELNKLFSYSVNAFRLDQYWGMFSPGVLKQDGWLVYKGLNARGEEWDLRHNNSPVSYQKPLKIVKHYKNDRWRKLAENLQSDHYTFLRHLYCSFHLKQWNLKQPEKKMDLLELYFMEKTNLPNYKHTTVTSNLLSICYAQ
jgi:hypothetical protein